MTNKTFLDVLEEIELETSDEIKIDLIQTLPSTLGENENPPYERGLEVIALQSNNVVETALIEQVYIFNSIVDLQTTEVFNYVLSGYVEPNPGDAQGTYSSFVGVYYSDIGEIT